MPRILIASCMQEVSSFNPLPSHYDDFRIERGQGWLDSRRQISDEIGGALGVFETDDSVQLVPTLGAKAITSGGTLAASDWEQLSTEFLSALEGAGNVDAAYFCLHGAMSAEGEEDPEGFLLAGARQILGEEIPFVTSLDLHGILTDRMLVHNDAVVLYHTYPHVDMGTTGERSARLLLRILNEQLSPVTARVRIPALVRGDELITESGLFGECIRAAQNIENGTLGLSAGMMIGNPFTDVPDLRTNSLVVLEQGEEEASRFATELAELFWQHHETMQVPLTPLERAFEEAAGVEGTVVMMDAADATSSGASGDSNAILAALLAAGYQGTALVPIVDPTAVEAAVAAGIGGSIDVTVGGCFDPGRFTPLPLPATVRLLSDGDFRSETFGQYWRAGTTAVLQAGSLTLVVTSRAVSLFDRSLFYAHGQDPRRFDLVVVKSPHCEPHMFADWCGHLINVDAPGSTSANLLSLGHTRCARPVFPLDEKIDFQPAVEIYQRGQRGS
ncbi:MAG: M81 family metallopeptidase [Planctomycetota bacterium]|nr:M81 family metallopeptidase [Planctomycetota bacterium]